MLLGDHCELSFVFHLHVVVSIEKSKKKKKKKIIKKHFFINHSFQHKNKLELNVALPLDLKIQFL